MSDLAKLVIKRFPENRNMQLVSFRMPARFHCARCKTTQRAAVAAVVAGDWENLWCAACYEKALLEPPEENLADSIPNEWLGSAVPLEDVERDNLADGLPFGNQLERWEQFKAAMIEGDEICCFCSPPDSSERLANTGGYALVRQGKVIHCIVTLTS